MYSEELIKEVKECYPDDTKIHELAEQGNPSLGRYLVDNSSTGIPLNTVLSALTLSNLQDKARAQLRKVECYRMWCKEDPQKR